VYETDTRVPVPRTTRLSNPPSQTPFSRRNRHSCTPATANKAATPATRVASAHVELSAMPTAPAAICAAIATPIDVKNQDGILMRCASIARDASASASAAEASGAEGFRVFSILESIAVLSRMASCGWSRTTRHVPAQLGRPRLRGVFL